MVILFFPARWCSHGFITDIVDSFDIIRHIRFFFVMNYDSSTNILPRQLFVRCLFVRARWLISLGDMLEGFESVDRATVRCVPTPDRNHIWLFWLSTIQRPLGLFHQQLLLLRWYTIATESVHQQNCSHIIHTLLTSWPPSFIVFDYFPPHFFFPIIIELVLYELPQILVFLPGHLVGCVHSYIMFYLVIFHDFVPLKIWHYQGVFNRINILSFSNLILARRYSSQLFLGLLL